MGNFGFFDALIEGALSRKASSLVDTKAVCMQGASAQCSFCFF
jgi:hypothetical protein